MLQTRQDGEGGTGRKSERGMHKSEKERKRWENATPDPSGNCGVYTYNYSVLVLWVRWIEWSGGCKEGCTLSGWLAGRLQAAWLPLTVASPGSIVESVDCKPKITPIISPQWRFHLQSPNILALGINVHQLFYLLICFFLYSYHHSRQASISILHIAGIFVWEL